MLLSQSTEGLMVSTLSMVALAKESLQCGALGANYVLARRINQDPVEVFFGYQRRRNDAEKHLLYERFRVTPEVLMPYVAMS